jgi:hypothetical protein
MASEITLNKILAMEEGPERTAALAAWVQGLFDKEKPVLVGGSAVELYTGGAYTTGDLDFVGTVTSAVARKLLGAGFTRSGRHFIHEDGRIFLDFPGSQLDPGVQAVRVTMAGREVLLISLEDIIIDRLAAWTYWNSPVDGANAYLLYSSNRGKTDIGRLWARARAEEVDDSLESLLSFTGRHPDLKPGDKPLEDWAKEIEQDE